MKRIIMTAILLHSIVLYAQSNQPSFNDLIKLRQLSFFQIATSLVDAGFSYVEDDKSPAIILEETSNRSAIQRIQIFVGGKTPEDNIIIYKTNNLNWYKKAIVECFDNRFTKAKSESGVIRCKNADNLMAKFTSSGSNYECKIYMYSPYSTESSTMERMINYEMKQNISKVRPSTVTDFTLLVRYLKMRPNGMIRALAGLNKEWKIDSQISTSSGNTVVMTCKYNVKHKIKIVFDDESINACYETPNDDEFYYGAVRYLRSIGCELGQVKTGVNFSREEYDNYKKNDPMTSIMVIIEKNQNGVGKIENNKYYMIGF